MMMRRVLLPSVRLAVRSFGSSSQVTGRVQSSAARCRLALPRVLSPGFGRTWSLTATQRSFATTAAEKALASKLETALDALFVEVVDTTGGCSPQPSYRITVVSPQFTGKRMLQQHKLVYAALGDEMDNMHASILVTRTPEQHAA